MHLWLVLTYVVRVYWTFIRLPLCFCGWCSFIREVMFGCMLTLVVCVLICREWRDWRWRSHSNCRRVGEEYFTEEITSWMCVSLHFILHSCMHLLTLGVSCLIWRMKVESPTYVINIEWMNDRLWNWRKRCQENRRNDGEKCISTWTFLWESPLNIH